MKKLMRYLKPSWKAALAAPLFMVLEVAMDLMQPQLMSDIIDRGVAAHQLSVVLFYGVRMLLAACAGIIGGTGCIVFSSLAGMHFGTDLRQALFDKVQTFSYRELDEHRTSQLVTNLTNDIMQVQNFVMMGLRMLVRAPLLCAGCLLMACLINAKLALILVVSMPILLAAVLIIMRKGFPLFQVMQERIDRVNGVTRETLTAVRVVKVYVRQDHEKERFGRANDELMAAGVKASRTMILLWPIVGFLLNGSVVAALWFGGTFIREGTMQAGQIMAFINYLMQILFSFMMVAMILINASRAMASATRISAVLDTDVSIRDPEQAKEASGSRVEFRDVSFRYPGADGEPALSGVSFVAEQGQTVGILGATGSGKSTLVSLIPRLQEATSGQVLVGGVDVREQRIKALRMKIGFAMQESVLFSGTVEENLRWGSESAGHEQVERAAMDAQAHSFVSKMEDGYGAVLGQRGVNLSGGQKQRLSIARALVRDPEILILDDSTSAVDMGTEARIQEALRRGKGRRTVFIIAQRISSVAEADKILVMDDGHVAAQGTHAELLKTCELYRDIVRSQLGEEALANA